MRVVPSSPYLVNNPEARIIIVRHNPIGYYDRRLLSVLPTRRRTAIQLRDAMRSDPRLFDTLGCRIQLLTVCLPRYTYRRRDPRFMSEADFMFIVYGVGRPSTPPLHRHALRHL